MACGCSRWPSELRSVSEIPGCNSMRRRLKRLLIEPIDPWCTGMVARSVDRDSTGSLEAGIEIRLAVCASWECRFRAAARLRPNGLAERAAGEQVPLREGLVLPLMLLVLNPCHVESWIFSPGE